jgi:hypothetical protein
MPTCGPQHSAPQGRSSYSVLLFFFVLCFCCGEARLAGTGRDPGQRGTPRAGPAQAPTPAAGQGQCRAPDMSADVVAAAAPSPPAGRVAGGPRTPAPPPPRPRATCLPIAWGSRQRGLRRAGRPGGRSVGARVRWYRRAVPVGAVGRALACPWCEGAAAVAEPALGKVPTFPCRHQRTRWLRVGRQQRLQPGAYSAHHLSRPRAGPRVPLPSGCSPAGSTRARCAGRATSTRPGDRPRAARSSPARSWGPAQEQVSFTCRESRRALGRLGDRRVRNGSRCGDRRAAV